MTKEQFITELIQKLYDSSKIKTVVHIPNSTVIVEMHSGDKFHMTVGKKMRA